MKKQFLLIATLFIIAILLPSKAAAQTYDDVIYLKNGSIIRGIIIEQKPNESLKIQTYDGNVFFYEMGEIEKFTKEVRNTRAAAAASQLASDYQQNPTKSYSPEYYKRFSYMGIVQVGGAIGADYWEAHHSSVTMINGFRIIPQFAFGVGVGMMVAFPYDEAEVVMPVFMHLRSDILNRKVSPYVSLNVGYNASLTDSFINGYMVENEFGVRLNSGRPNKSVMFGAYWNVSRTLALISSRYTEYIEEDACYSIGIKVGFSF